MVEREFPLLNLRVMDGGRHFGVRYP